MFKSFVILLMFPLTLVSMDEARQCIIEEAHRYENDDTMKCYFAKKDLFIECCVQASTTHTASIHELFTKIKEKKIDIDSPYVLLTPRDLFVRLLKNIPIERKSDNDRFPPCYTAELNTIKIDLFIEKVLQFPFVVEHKVGYTPLESDNKPEQTHSFIEIKEYDFGLDLAHIALPLSDDFSQKKSYALPFVSKLLAERHSDVVGFELFSEDFEVKHMTHHKEIVAIFKALIK